MSFRSKVKAFIRRYSAKSIAERLGKLIANVQKSVENTGNSFYRVLLIISLVCLIGVQRIGLFLKNIFDEIADVIASIWRFFEKILNSVLDFFRNIIKKIWDFLINFWDRIIALFEEFWNFLISIWDRIIALFEKIWDSLVSFIKLIIEDFREFLNLAWQFIRKVFFLSVIEEVGFYFKRLKDYSKNLKERLDNIVQKLREYSKYLGLKFTDKMVVYRPSIITPYWELSGYSLLWLLVVISWGLLTIGMTVILTLGTVIGLPLLHQYIRKDLIGNDEE